MVTRRYSALRGLATSIVVCLFVLTNATVTRAQEEERSSSAVADVVKGVVFDPTTWAPAVVSYDATMRDWRTSQPFFRNGFVEHNPRFTVSGRPDDRAISYEAGHRLILRDSLATLGVSAAQNLASRIVERSLLQRYPEHRKVVKTIGWIQRIAIGSVMTYRLSATHYRQATLNAERSRQLGLR